VWQRSIVNTSRQSEIVTINVPLISSYWSLHTVQPNYTFLRWQHFPLQIYVNNNIPMNTRLNTLIFNLYSRYDLVRSILYLLMMMMAVTFNLLLKTFLQYIPDIPLNIVLNRRTRSTYLFRRLRWTYIEYHMRHILARHSNTVLNFTLFHKRKRHWTCVGKQHWHRKIKNLNIPAKPPS